MSNFSKIFRNVTYDNIKSHKKAGLHTFYRKYIFRKTSGGVKLTPNLMKLTENSFFQLVICIFAKQDNNDQWLSKITCFYKLFIFTSIKFISRNIECDCHYKQIKVISRANYTRNMRFSIADKKYNLLKSKGKRITLYH